MRKNMNQVNKRRKKQGEDRLVLTGEKGNKIVGRNYIVPILLILFILLYSFVMQGDPEYKSGTMYWVTMGCYVLLAALFFFRRPYLMIGKDFVQSRRFTGDKRIQASEVKEIRVQQGFAAIDFHKGTSWTFTRLLNRFPTEVMAEQLKAFAHKNNIAFTEK